MDDPQRYHDLNGNSPDEKFILVSSADRRQTVVGNAEPAPSPPHTQWTVRIQLVPLFDKHLCPAHSDHPAINDAVKLVIVNA